SRSVKSVGAEALLDGSRQGRSRRGVRSIGLWQVDADQMRQWARAVLGGHHHGRFGCDPLARAHGRHVRLHSGRSFGRDTKGSNNEPHELPIKIPATNTSTPPTMT